MIPPHPPPLCSGTLSRCGLGHVAVLIVHRTIIHCRADTPLTLRYLKGKALVDIPPLVEKTLHPGMQRKAYKKRAKGESRRDYVQKMCAPIVRTTGRERIHEFVAVLGL